MGRRHSSRVGLPIAFCFLDVEKKSYAVLPPSRTLKEDIDKETNMNEMLPTTYLNALCTPVPQEVYHGLYHSLCSLSPSSTWWKDELYLAISHLYEVKEMYRTAQDTNLTSQH